MISIAVSHLDVKADGSMLVTIPAHPDWTDKTVGEMKGKVAKLAEWSGQYTIIGIESYCVTPPRYIINDHVTFHLKPCDVPSVK